MASSVRCAACKAYYNGFKYNACPYCGNKPASSVADSEPEKVEKTEKKEPGGLMGFLKRTTHPQKTEVLIEPENTPVQNEIESTENTIGELIQNVKEEQKNVSDVGTDKGRTIGIFDLNSQREYEEKKAAVEVGEEREEKPEKSESGSLSYQISKSGRTVGKYISNSSGEAIAPVVGWIIGVKGADYGRSFNLKSGKNKIGRSKENDIALDEESVSRSCGAVIIFDSKSKEYSILPGESDSLCYVDGEALYERKKITGFNEIEFGDSEINKYIFCPFCGESFDWSKYPNKE